MITQLLNNSRVSWNHTVARFQACAWCNRSSEMLHSDGWSIVFDVSGQPIRSIFKGRSPRVVNRHQRIGGACWIHLQDKIITSHLKMKTPGSS